MFRNVHIGVDGSPTGGEAIALAIALAEPDAHMTLAHVHGGEISAGGVLNRAFGADGPEDAQRLLETERDAAKISAELISICAPSVGRGLHALAERQAADLLVVGSHTRGPTRVLMGDDTRGSLTLAPCAVAIAPHGYIGHAGGFTTVGVGYDYSSESQVALAVARELAARYDSKIDALYVVTLPAGSSASTPGDWAQTLEDGRKYAQEKLESLEGVGATAVFGRPSDELAAFSERVDLLVVGSRSYGPIRRLLLGSTSSSLAGSARCPLLVLPRTATETRLAGGDREGSAAPVGTSS